MLISAEERKRSGKAFTVHLYLGSMSKFSNDLCHRKNMTNHHLKTFLFCHFSTNILFFVQKLCELHVLTTPLSYLWLNSLVCVHDTCITKMSVCSFYAKFSLVSLICMVPVREPRHIKKKRIILFSLQHVPLLKDGVLWHTWSSFDMMVKLSRTLLGL